MKDFMGIEIKIGDKVFVSWGGTRHAVGKVDSFKGKTRVIIKQIEKTTNPHPYQNVKQIILVWNAKNLIILS